MNKTFKIAFSLRNTYRVNTILYSLKQIPLIKRLLPQELYRDPDLKLLSDLIRDLGVHQGVPGEIPVFSADGHIGSGTL